MIIPILLNLAIIFGQNLPSSFQEPLTTYTPLSIHPLHIDSDFPPTQRSANAPCLGYVSKNNVGANPKTVEAVLNRTTCADGFDITLLDAIHYESVLVNISKGSPVLIKGGPPQDGQDIFTTWSVNTSAEYTIQILKGYLTLQIIEFKYFVSVNQGCQPSESIIKSYYAINFISLTTKQCVFSNTGANINASKMIDQLDITEQILRDTIFQDVKSNSVNSIVSGSTTQSATRFILENCTFQNIDISYSSGQGAYSAVLNGVNQTVVINKSTFRNCSNQLSATGAGAIFISFSNASVVSNEINITSSRFLYNAGYNTGAIFSERVTNKVNLTNNQFIGNSQIAVASGKGRDAQLAWPKYSSVQTADAAKQKVQQLFNGGTSTIRNSIHYLFIVNDKEDANGFIDLNVTQELCQSKAEMTADCMCDPDSTTYPAAQCQKDKLCITDLSHQTPSNCPCLNTSDPRAGQTCPAYCVKGNVTSDCTCNSNTSGYTVAQCNQEKLCKFNLSTQTPSNCPCLNTSDPRAGQTCSAYCTGKNTPSSNCTCDSNSTNYPITKCQQDKQCDINLINQTIENCPCLNTSDPRAGKGECPAYCIKGQVNQSCVCDTGNSSFPLQSCQTEKLCITDLASQTNATCPCLNTSDPRAGKGQCPAYCVKGSVTTNCTCDTNLPGFTVSQCQQEKQCLNNLVNQTAANCPCQPTGDPRAGQGQCPAYCVKGNVTSDCVCDSNTSGYTVAQCNQEKLCKFNLSTQTPSNCPCLNTSDPRAGQTCPAYCVKDYATATCTCDTNATNYTVSQCQQEKLCITNLVNQTIANCPCLPTGDPRAGKGQCPAYCTGPNAPTSDCVCDSNPSAQYPPQTCQSNKKCTASSNTSVPQDSCTCTGSNNPTGCKCPTDSTELTGIPSSRCACRTTADPRANGICPAYCVKGSVNSSCTCDTGSSTYPSTQCQQEKLCITSLANQTAANCPCLSTGDPRAGKGQCPAYCTGPNNPTSDCACDSNPSAQYPPATCWAYKGQCTVSSGSSVPQDSCTCSGSNYPSGCKCPTDSSQLTGIPKERCECRTTADPRANGICPAYCQRGYTTTDCFCDTGSQTYPQSTCQKDKLCITNLIQQSKADCPCLMKADPRAGGVCPAYCISKAELTVECMCELGSSSYPQATCERDKLCIVDLIHQSTANCPCLVVDDPRGESVCKQTDIDPSDPDPTDPIIPDPSEKDPETDQEQGGGPKEDEDEKKTEKEESGSSSMIWIIFVVVGVMAVAVIVVISFFVFRSRNQKKKIEIQKKNKEIQMEYSFSIDEVSFFAKYSKFSLLINQFAFFFDKLTFEFYFFN
ncbi:MAG: hypothetical protein EZS28_003383 [Streblomastix strix]|uniref:EGF-like domain-containing protein n=1 Tax=Streblomastix strix TaxID=222440 RepID=A0A5J4X3M5_9EUKA|nr:MAG: hypothetical protein EZS28_003383 [Streblomastix strix]